MHTAIAAALAGDRALAVRVDLRPPFAWSVADTIDQLRGANAYVEELPRRRRLVVAGATDLAANLATLAEPLRRRVVVDPRSGHVASGAFPETVEVVHAWPDEWIETHPLGPTDAVVALSHDPRIDDRAIRAALASEAGHVAALGSRTTHQERLRRLAGVRGLDRLAGPAGLDLGAASLADTALSIMAEVIAAENGRSGGRLRDGDLPIRASAGLVPVAG